MCALLLAGGGSVAWAELRLGVSAEAGASLMGAPLAHRMVAPDAVTRASVDAVTTASRPSHAGGLHVHLSAENAASLVLGLEYVRYRFDVDYQFARAAMSVFGLRLLALARLPLVRIRGNPVFFFAFGGYFEMTLYDAAELGGSWINIDVDPVGGGLAVGFHLEPYRIVLPQGHLVPGLFLRAYRGLAPQFRDELGSNAPFSSISVGVTLRYDLPVNTDDARR